VSIFHCSSAGCSREDALMAMFSDVITSRCRISSYSSLAAFELSRTTFYHCTSVYDLTAPYNDTNIFNTAEFLYVVVEAAAVVVVIVVVYKVVDW